MKIEKGSSNSNIQNVYYNDVLVGQFVKEVDGFFYFFDDKPNRGLWQSHILRFIADKLDEINKPYQDILYELYDILNENKKKN
jgi:hypothetical protein